MESVATLLSHPSIWRGDQLGTVQVPSLPTGFPALDAQLPGRGWPTAALTEILPQHEGIGEIRILGQALANLSSRGRWIAWVAPPHIPYAPALQAAGIDLARFLRINTRSWRETLWAIEQALHDNSCGAVVAWPSKISYPELRRLQLAAAGSQALAVLFRDPKTAIESSPAALRLHLQTHQGGLAVRIVKRRGHALTTSILLHPSSVVRSRKPLVFMGPDAVQGLAISDEHRPERSWKTTQPGVAVKTRTTRRGPCGCWKNLDPYEKSPPGRTTKTSRSR